MTSIWAYSESAGVANEVASAASAIAGSGDEVVVLTVDSGEGLGGEKKVFFKASAPLEPSPDAAAEAISRRAKQAPPDVILVGSTRNGKEVAARLAVKLGRACAGDVFSLSVSDGALHVKRNVFAGKVVADVALPLPCVAAVKVGAYPSVPPTPSPAEQVDVEVQPGTRLAERQEKKRGTVDLRNAKLIVSAGRGVKKKEDLALVGDLAAELGGAVGCSRPLSSDMGWLPEEHHIGLTGVSVHPDLYLAVGISGQLQHVAGIKDSKVIAAVNSDKTAPIFEAADYGVVGDLYSVLPAMMKEVRSRRGR